MNNIHIPANEAQDYLRRFRGALGSLPADIREDLVAELRSHIEERQTQAPFSPTQVFGSPEVYASQFIVEQRLSTAVNSGRPLELIASLFVTTRLTATLLFLVFPLIVVEIFGLGLTVLGALKPFSTHIGLFLYPDGAFGGLGWINQPGSAHEVLGYGVMPVFIISGLLTFWLGYRLLVTLGRRELARMRARS